MSAPTPATVGMVTRRDWGACARCGRYVVELVRGRDWSIHHRRPRGSGGSKLGWVNLPANLIILCGDATAEGGCHAWVESHRDQARALGFLVPLNGTALPAHVPIDHFSHGVVLLDDNGGVTSQAVNF